MRSTHRHASIGLLVYDEVFDVDVYADPKARIKGIQYQKFIVSRYKIFIAFSEAGSKVATHIALGEDLSADWYLPFI